jgi:hypothetical protein
MKIKFGETHAEKQEWHKFYAVWPRHVGGNDWRCFEYVLRRWRVASYNASGRFISDAEWEYEVIEDDDSWVEGISSRMKELSGED